MSQDRDINPIIIGGVELARIERRLHEYNIEWPTQETDSKILRALLRFHTGLRESLGPNLRSPDKLFPVGIMVFQLPDNVTDLPLGELLKPSSLAQYLLEQNAIAIRVNTPYADMFYDTTLANSTPRKLQVTANLNLSDPISRLFRSTAIKPPAIEVLFKLPIEMNRLLENYPQPILK